MHVANYLSYPFLGISTWGKRVGRKFDQIKIGESSEKLHYVVNRPLSPSGHGHGHSASVSELMIGLSSEADADDAASDRVITTEDLVLRSSHALSQPELRHRLGSDKPMVKRRVSRVESLRNLFFNRSNVGQQQASTATSSSGIEARKRFLLKKRARSAEKGTEKVSYTVRTQHTTRTHLAV